jgi:hypothetical protein
MKDPNPLQETWVLDWDTEASPHYRPHVDAVVSMNGDRVVRTDCGAYTRCEADLHLIAAAPDLYRALEAIVRVAHFAHEGDRERLAGAAAAALAKARGKV